VLWKEHILKNVTTLILSWKPTHGNRKLFSLWWNIRARKQMGHHLHSATPQSTSDQNAAYSAVLIHAACEEAQGLWKVSSHKEWYNAGGSIISQTGLVTPGARNDRGCISSHDKDMSIYPGSPKYVHPVIQFIFATPLSPSVLHLHLSIKLSSGGGGIQISLPQLLPGTLRKVHSILFI